MNKVSSLVVICSVIVCALVLLNQQTFFRSSKVKDVPTDLQEPAGCMMCHRMDPADIEAANHAAALNDYSIV